VAAVGQKTSVDLERRDLVAMQLEDVIEVQRTTRKIADVASLKAEKSVPMGRLPWGVAVTP
jgi:hypothetical protein